MVDAHTKQAKPNRFSGASPAAFHEKFDALLNELPYDTLSGKNAPTNVMGQMMVNPEMADLFVPYWVKTKAAISLAIQDQEFIMLRSAVIFNCDYVWGHHVPVMQNTGMARSTINQIARPIEDGDWSDKDKALLMAVDAIYAKADVDEALWASLKQHFTDKNIMDIISVCSQYLLFNATNNVFGLRLEHDGLPTLPTE